MTDLPDDTIAVYLAVRRPCQLGRRNDGTPWCGFYRNNCDGCLGDGTRKEHTSVEVENPHREHSPGMCPWVWWEVDRG